ncbi:MAG TPA: DoxX family protein, partial [Myxococcota bacterium]|nr:DoxX family protein [Myxococcota bacterium]
LGALAATGYMFPLLKATETLMGALLLANLAVPFALVVLAPIVVNIAAFHLALAPEGLGVVVAIVAAGLAVAHAHRAAFAPLFRPAWAAPAGSQVEAAPLRAAA